MSLDAALGSEAEKLYTAADVGIRGKRGRTGKLVGDRSKERTGWPAVWSWVLYGFAITVFPMGMSSFSLVWLGSEAPFTGAPTAPFRRRQGG